MITTHSVHLPDHACESIVKVLGDAQIVLKVPLALRPVGGWHDQGLGLEDSRQGAGRGEIQGQKGQCAGLIRAYYSENTTATKTMMPSLQGYFQSSMLLLMVLISK